jgi:hypothetical protein
VSGSPLTVLITVRELAIRAGTQLYTRDLAEELRRLGHRPIVFTSLAGRLARELRAGGVPVVSDLAALAVTPDVVHGQHHLEAMAAMLRFPSVPAVFVCHGWLPWVEAPPRFPTLLRYAAVDSLRCERLVVEHGIPAARVALVHNFVDLERFRPRPPLPEHPRRALLLSNQATGDAVLPVVAEACRRRGLELTAAGLGLGHPLDRPEEELRSYDVVLARGRAALEAMAVGAAVVLCDLEGDGPLVTPDNFAALRDLNFGLGALRAPLVAERLEAELSRYGPMAAAEVSARVRREAGRPAAVARLLELYREAIAEASLLPADGHAEACLRAAASYAAWLAPSVLERELKAAEHWQEWQAAEARAAAEGVRRAELEGSLVWRMRRRLLRVPGLVAAYRRLRGLGEAPGLTAPRLD